MWYIGNSENEKFRYGELQKKVIGITATMLTKCLRELETDGLIKRKQYSTIPPTVEYYMTDKGCSLVKCLDPLHDWGKKYMNK